MRFYSSKMDISAIELEKQVIKRMKHHYERHNKKDMVLHYIINNGGLQGIKTKFGSLKRFLFALGPDPLCVGFTRQYIERLEKLLNELESQNFQAKGYSDDEQIYINR